MCAKYHSGSITDRDGSLDGVSPLEALTGQSGAANASHPIITITDNALSKMFELRADEADAEQLGLRLAIASGPGEDFKYDLSFDEFLKAAFTDEVRTHTGSDGSTIKVIIPAADVERLQDATLDYTESQGLVIRNPNRPQAPNVEGLVRDDELSAEIEALVTAEVNPALAAHGGFVTYVGHDGEGTAYMTMGGGCHGCSMSKATMLDGVQTMLSEALPAVQRVRDLTDHSTGENPYFS
jgi:Fe/S biogenesis protein NfuA